MKIFKIFLVLSLLSIRGYSQEVIDSREFVLRVQPTPQKVEPMNKAIVIDNGFIPVVAAKDEERKAANYFKYLFEKRISQNIKVIIGNEGNVSSDAWKISLKLVDHRDSFVNEQYYFIQCSLQKKEIEISSPSQLGLLYGVVTFSKFINSENNSVKINLFNVSDYPAYSKRIFSAAFKTSQVDELLDFALMNKIETVALASRIYPWYKADDAYKNILTKIKSWKEKFGGPKILQMLNIYDKKKIEISNPNDIDSLQKVIELGIESGVEKLMILADDTPPFKFGEGYVLTNDNDKKQFKSMAEANIYLMNELNKWLKSKSHDIELYYCPAFYTYEDMHYGDIALYKNTPWEKDAYKPLMRDLNYIGLNMPENVFIIWTGPNVRSRKITINDLNDWTNNLKGRIPFLWDNTIYSQHPFTSSPLFTAWDNALPSDFYKRTAGNGMFINCDLNSEETKAAAITTNDYMWNPTKYNPENSLNIAMENRYGKQTAELLLQFKDTELSLRKKIGERNLWFEADTLWTIIRKIRFITEKNPWYYQQNYNRMKALRLQLKNSVPEPESQKSFEEMCDALDLRRNEIVSRIYSVNIDLAEKLKGIMIPLPVSKIDQ